MKKYRIGTQCVQEGYRPSNGQPRVLPIYQSTTFKYDSSSHVGDLFDLKVDGHMYTRISNPTFAAVEEKIAVLEGGSGAMLTASGQAASLMAILNVCKAGDNFLASSVIYGGTINLMSVQLERMGIEVRYFLLSETDAEVESKIDSHTRLLFGETIANPVLRIFDIERYANLAHRHGIPLVIDNTFATPYLCRPFEHGANVVIHSTSKYMDGHACAIGGVIVDGGNFDWSVFPEFSQPNASYHGVVYSEQFGNAAYIAKARTMLLRDFGAVPGPYNAFLLNLGLETLHLRMERHCQNAMEVSRYLQSKLGGDVCFVHYPGLSSDPDYPLAKKYLKNEQGVFIGASGVVSFGVAGGRERAAQWMDALKLAAIVVHVADARTSVLHPASTTHRQLTDEQLSDCGITPELIRLSVGIESASDIIEDLEQALNASR